MDYLSVDLQTLGLSPNATLQEAEAAYRDLIRVWHPDRFLSDPQLQSKAEEQTVRINKAMRGVRKALKSCLKTARETPPQQRQHYNAPDNSRPREPSADKSLQFSPTLVIHKPLRALLAQALTGFAIFYLGAFLMLQFCERAGAQTALGVVLAAYGFSMSLGAVATACLKTPIIAINRSFLCIYGAPHIPIFEVIKAHVMVSRRGSSLSISCSPEYVRALPFLARWPMRLRYLLHGRHFELSATLLDNDPGQVIHMLNAVMSLNPPANQPASTGRTWGTYAHTGATLCLALAVARCLFTSDHQLLSLVPYLVLFALLRSAWILKTTVVAQPARYTSPH